MKTQISRDSFAPDQRYAGVFQQQGRMILDADWNELALLQNSRLVDALRDAIAGGAPRVGGLRLYADPAGSSTIRLQPGVLYVKGVPALMPGSEPIPITKQPDYPLNATFSGVSLKLYADVWDRCVTALERPELMDPALHGADTATRSQTLLQVKWCPAAQDPLDPAFNPSQGNAPVSLKLRKINSDSDLCNPCAIQVQVDDRLGNYLFRVEVHDVDLAAQTVTLKWSRDNGAEAAAVDELPTGFNQGDWVWEFFDQDTERLLGLHFAPNPLKLRGLLKDSCVTPLGDNEPKTHVRQWDGYGTFKLDTGALVAGRDRGVDLFTGVPANPAHGRAFVDGDALEVSLEALTLRLGFQGQQFVPGDYWQATVREAVQASGDVVLASGLPRGVRHHYLLLGELQADGKLKAVDDATRRRMAFPPLTDLSAADVGFTDHCPGLFMGAQNVQQALDNLCAIGADDISYTLPTCATSPNVRELLGLGGVSAKVSQVLDKLLCELNANDIPLDKTDAELCADLQLPSVVSVQDALKALCAHSGGCETVVRNTEQLMERLKQAAADRTGSVWIKLCAGRYEIPADIKITGLDSLRLSGESASACQVTITSETVSLEGTELIVENLTWIFKQPIGQLQLRAPTVTMRDCVAQRRSIKLGGPPMLSIGGRQGESCRLSFEHNQLNAFVPGDTRVSWAPPLAVGVDDGLVKLIQSLIKAVSSNANPVDVQTRLAEAWIRLPVERRKDWITAFQNSTLPLRHHLKVGKIDRFIGRGYTASELGGIPINIILGNTTPDVKEKLATVLLDMAYLSLVEQPDHALRLFDHKVGGCIEGCSIQGWLLMANGLETIGSDWPEANRVTFGGAVIEDGGAPLNIRDTVMSGVHSNIPPAAVSQDGALSKPVAGHSRLVFTGNNFTIAGSLFTAGSWIAQGNTWGYDIYAGIPPAMVICDRATFAANILEGFNDNTNIFCTTKDLASGQNILIELYAGR